jgi:hypothetical protein
VTPDSVPILLWMLPAAAAAAAAYASLLWRMLQVWEGSANAPAPDRWVLQAARHHAGAQPIAVRR